MAIRQNQDRMMTTFSLYKKNQLKIVFSSMKILCQGNNWKLQLKHVTTVAINETNVES
jgi:hypothetical protein